MKQAFKLAAASPELIEALAKGDTKASDAILADDIAADTERQAEKETAGPAADPSFVQTANGLFLKPANRVQKLADEAAVKRQLVTSTSMLTDVAGFKVKP